MTVAIPPWGEKVASSIWLVLTRSGKPGARLTILASGAPWIEVKRLDPSGGAANFASKRPAVMIVRWAEGCALPSLEFPGVIGIFAAPEVSAWSRRLPCATKKSTTGAVRSKSCGDEELAEEVAEGAAVLAPCCARWTPSIA